MRRIPFWTLAAALGIGLALSASPADAQGRGRGDGGPPFCRNGKGHPVHGWEWCEEKGFGRYDRGRYDSRYPYPDRRNEDHGRYDGRYGSYEMAHADFHRYLDRKYNRLIAQRPLDIRWQIEVRARKRAEHDDWHYRAGRRH